MHPTSRNKPLSTPQSPSVTQDPCQPSAQMAYFLQHFHCRNVALANITSFRESTRLTGKRMKVAAQQKGFTLYIHYQVHELKFPLHKVKGMSVISFFCHSEMSIISLLAWSSWQTLTAAVNDMKFMRFLHFLQERCQKNIEIVRMYGRNNPSASF